MLGIIGIRTIWKPKTGSHWNVWKFVPASEFHGLPGSYFFWHTSQSLREIMRKAMNRRNQEFTEIQKESVFLRFIDPILRFEPGHSFRKWPLTNQLRRSQGWWKSPLPSAIWQWKNTHLWMLFPLYNTSIYKGVAIAMFDYQRVHGELESLINPIMHGGKTWFWGFPVF